VARHGEVFYATSFGHRDIARGLPMTPDTICRLASMTKPITSVALMMLYEEGHFQLADPVHAFLPAFKDTMVHAGTRNRGHVLVPQNPEMNIKHLLTHTSGLSYGWYEDSPVDAMYRAKGRNLRSMGPDDAIESLASLPLVSQPGTRWRYSFSTDVVGCLVSTISGMPFDEYVAERIAKPLGMVDTGFCVPAEKVGRVATVYAQTDDGALVASPVSQGDPTQRPSFPSGGGGLLSTLPDYMRFARMLSNRGTLDDTRLLAPKTVDLMRINHLPQTLVPIAFDGEPKLGYGFGLGLRVLVDPAAAAKPGSLGNHGWDGAFETHFWIDPVEELVGIVMPQLAESNWRLPRDFEAMVYQAMVE